MVKYLKIKNYLIEAYFWKEHVSPPVMKRYFFCSVLHDLFVRDVSFPQISAIYTEL